LATAMPEVVAGSDACESRGGNTGGRCARIAVLPLLLLLFVALELFVPLRTAVQIGPDEGFELAKGTRCSKGHNLYTEVWNDQPPLHTFLITKLVTNISWSILIPRLVTVGCECLALCSR